MFLAIFLFELKYRFRRPATYIYFAMLALVAMLLVASGNTPASEKVFHNAPVLIAELQLLISLFAIMIAAAVMGVPIYRDIEHKTGTFMFSYPIDKTSYFMGRFWGSFVVLLFISLGVTVGFLLGTIIGPATGWTEALRYGPNKLSYFLYPWATLVVPNLWLSATLFFALIIFTKNIRSIYSGGIIVFIAYLLANFLAQDIENKDLVQIIDPFGINSFSFQARYLTPYEQNNFILNLEGNLLLNRLLWLGVGLLFFLTSYFRFSFSYFFQSGSKKKRKKSESDASGAPASIKNLVTSVSFGRSYQISSLWTLAAIEIRNILRDGYFRAILLGGLIFLAIDFWILNSLYSVSSLPVTSVILEYKGFDYLIFVFIIIVFFTGETLHRDKSTGYAKISDTFPVSNGVLIASKFLGMVAITFVLATIPIVVGVIVQLLKGYTNLKIGWYLIDTYLITFPDFVQMVMLVFAVHMIVNSKFAGHAAAIAVWLIILVLRNFAGYDFNLFFYSYEPGYRWSEMNGLGHFAEPLLWFNIYWTSFGIFLLLFAAIFYTRGSESTFKSRLIAAKSRLTQGPTLVAYSFLIVSILSGAYIYNNVAYKNEYTTSDEGKYRRAEYEKQLKKYEFMPQPKLVSVNLKADLYPKERDAFFSAKVVMVNKTEETIDSVFLDGSSFSDYDLLYNADTLPYRKLLKIKAAKYRIFGEGKTTDTHRMYRLPKSMQPGDSLSLTLYSEIRNDGFVNSGFSREVIYNGTFVGGGIPDIGYSARGELSSDEDRREYELPEKDYELPPHEDPYGRRTLLFSDEADLIDFEATISTVEDQIAIAPGYLQKEWTEDGRRYFHYIQDTPIQAFFNIVSAEYDVLEDKVLLSNGKEINIEIFHHPEHKYNLDRFLASYKDGLEYFSNTYGDFQFRQMRLLEFPRYAGFAQSFPNTVPFAESFGWVADFDDPDDFDYVYYVTGHELAHQWWGHQITPNYTRGSNLISEALAEYSALVLTERKYGTDNMKRFLKQELDSYLSGRANENKKENTFINCNRAYQWYRKGSLVLYGLRDYIGAAAIDSAIRNFRDEFALREEPPYPGSSDLYRHLEAYTPDSLKYYLEDTWKKITLYQNKAVEASYVQKAEDNYEVTLQINTAKMYADSAGMETPAVYDGDYIDIGIFAPEDKDEDGRTRTNPLYIRKHKLAPGEHTITIIVNQKPEKAGIDPYNRLIDRIPDDNTVTVDEST